MPAWDVPLADVVVPEEDIALVADVYRSGWLSMGPRTEAFEAAFAAYTGARHAIAVTNGTAALHLACLAAGLGPGDEVIVPAMTFVASVNAIAYTGATPVFAEISSPTEPWLAAAAVEAAITPNTRAVMIVHYAGHPGEVDAVAALAETRGLRLIEDAAHAAGSRHRGRHLGRFGALGAFSFFSNKNLAVGEGGALITDDDELAAAVRLRRSHGMTTLSWDRHRGHASEYDVVVAGFNYRIDEPRAALAESRLARLDDENLRRAMLDARYRARLAELAGLRPLTGPPPESTLSHHLFAVVLDPGLDRARFREALAERRLQTSVHYPPAHRFAIYASGAPSLPVTEDYARRTVTLPLYPHMTEAQQDLVVDALGEALRRASKA